MNVHPLYKRLVTGTLLVFGLSFVLNQALFAQLRTDAPPAPPQLLTQAPAPAQVQADVAGIEVLTRGPVHEAFAETVTFDPEPGIITPKAPPAAIEEIPPEQRIEGDNVAWIPGYWAWDDERNDFLWVSGIWRTLPPGRQWMPGYWQTVENGSQWISGYWADAESGDAEYLPAPPATVEAGPNIPATSADQTWLPGCWVWHQNRYVWRPGFWATVQPNWIWVPSHYVWAPRGYVFVDGYWDYSINRRGILFAPVYLNASVYARRGFSYSPTTVIDLGVFTNHLFMRPRYQHYYFGDYYATSYRGAGFLPWFSINLSRSGYDPIYPYSRWQHRQDRGWEQRQQVDFNNRRDHEHLRPPRTWASQGLRSASSSATANVGLPGVALRLDDLRKNEDSTLRFQSVNPSERNQYRQYGRNVEKFRAERQKRETREVGPPTKIRTDKTEIRTDRSVPTRVKLPGSPVVAKPLDKLGKDYTPPKTYQVPKFDSKVIAKPRATRSSGPIQKHTMNRMPLDQTQPKPNIKRNQPDDKRRPDQQHRSKSSADQGKGSAHKNSRT